jgi:Ca-activated chloride channel family protein
MNERDDKLDGEIRRELENLEVPVSDPGARQQAIRAALTEFEAVHAETESPGKTFFQGFLDWLRPIVSDTTDKGSSVMPFNQRFIVTSMTMALAGLVAVGVTLQYDSGSEPSVIVEGRNEAGPVATAAEPSITSSKDDREADEISLAAPLEQRVAQESIAKAKPHSVIAERKVARQRTDGPVDALGGQTFPAAGQVAADSAALKSIVGEREMADMDIVAPTGYQDVGRDSFEKFEQNPVKLVSEEPVSTFSVDVDTASYSFVRRQLNNGVLPQLDAVRAEELINYFDYDYPLPDSRERPFQPTVAVADSPWAEGRKLVHIGIKGFDLKPQEKPRSNLVFLLDVSGSMNSPDKLPLVKQSMELLLNTLDADDTVAIAVYAGAAGTVLEPTPVKEKQKILDAMNQLSAGGSTAGAQGIRLAYELAQSQFDESAINRVILATDGDFNVGITNQRELQGFIERKRDKGIFLSVLGFGQGNYQDSLMQTLAQNGNGVAAYIDTLSEAQKVLVHEATSTLFPIAKDVKIQLEFNPATVAEYRLIGYETRHLNREDFNNDAVDAGDIGAGHTVTAIYEITPAGSEARLIDASRYQKSPAKTGEATDAEYAFLKIRYKLPDQDKSHLITQPISGQQELDQLDSATLEQEVEFATAVAGFAQLLKGGKYTNDYSYDDVITLAQQSKGSDAYGYRTEFVQLARKAKTASAMRRR